MPVERIELPTFGLQNRCSTAELNRQTMGEIVRSHPRWFCRLVVRNGADGKRAVKYQTCWPRATATKSGSHEKAPWTKSAPRNHPTRVPDAIIAPWNHWNREGAWRGSGRSRRFLSHCRFWSQLRPSSARRIRHSASPMRGPRWSRCGKGWRARVAARACRGRAGRPSFRFTTNGVSKPRATSSPPSEMRARKF